MARRGYFEKQSGNYRLRLVEEGYDADNEATPTDKVIIDSNSLGSLSVVRAGVGVIPNQSSYDAGLWVASGWGLPYVPLCTFLFGYYAAGGLWNTYTPLINGFGLPGTQFNVSSDGIYVKGVGAFIPSGTFPLYVRWAAYRLPV